MNVLFISVSSLPNLCEHSISLDLIREFKRNGHTMYVICSIERRNGGNTSLSEEDGCTILRVKTGNVTKSSIIEKGISTVILPRQFRSAIKRHFNDIKFDLVIYPTPPVTQVSTVKYIKKRDGARSYLLLKDIFPQNAVDIGMMTTTGLKGLLYKYFRKQEIELYAVSDNIGCMSEANVRYLLAHNPEIDNNKVGVCPNSIEPEDMRVSDAERKELRLRYNIPLDKKVFVYGGNLGRPQGIPFVIKCLRKCREIDDAIFLIIGNGTEYSKLKAFVDDEKPRNVKLMKRLPKEDYDRLVAACDVGLIFLDHRFTIPNFPSRLLGYMQAGLPVLACTDTVTDVGAVIVDGGFGWWCESNDVRQFADLVEVVLKQSDEEKHKITDIEKKLLSSSYNVSQYVKQITEGGI